MDGAVHPTLLESISAWVLVVTFALSLAYELWRATAKAGASRHDSMRASCGNCGCTSSRPW